MGFSNKLLNDFGVYDMENKTISKPYSNHVMTLLEMVNHHIIYRLDDKFYALGQRGNLLTFSVTSDSNSELTTLECGFPANAFIMKYLVDSNGKQDWLMVDRACDWEDHEELVQRFAKEFNVLPKSSTFTNLTLISACG
ncbi:hypothetical protein ACLB2K_061533 [Fragaria x ananassa]